MSAGDIKKAVQILAGQHNNDTVRLFDAEVKSVNQAERTCEVLMIGGKSSNTITVRLMASVDDGAYFIPKVGTTVIVTMSDHVEPYVSLYSEIDNIIWLGGEYESVPIVTHPTDENKGLWKKINSIETLLNHLINQFNIHRHPTACGAGAGNAVATVDPELNNINPTTIVGDISHPNIKH